MRGILGDLKLALRTLARSPTYVLVAVLTLGLGIGATTAIFSVVEGVLLRPLPYKDPDRLAIIWETAPKFERMSVSYPDYLDWEKTQASFDGLGCYRSAGFNLTGDGRPERLSGMMMSATLLPALGVTPLLGRGFTADEDREQGPPVALLGHGLWQRRFGGSPDVLGTRLTLDGTSFTIVGVLRPELRLDPRSEIATPIGRLTGKGRERGNHPGIRGIARLKPGVTLAQARADLDAAGAAIEKAFPDNAEVRPLLLPLHADMVKEVRPMLLILLCAVFLVLAIAVGNVANLALARGTVRRKEMAVRAALGAGRGRLVRQVLVEAGILSLLGGCLGVLVALWGVDLLAALRPESIPQGTVIRVDAGVLAFSLGASLLSGMLFGVLPALHAARANVNDALKEGDLRTTTGGPRGGRARAALVVGEVAIALMLLVGAGLSLRAFVALSRTDQGFVPGGVLTMTAELPRGRYDAEKLRVFREQLSERLRAVPGVATATVSTGIPLGGASETSYAEAKATPARSDVRFGVYYPVDGQYLEALGLRLLTGRFLTDHDDAHAKLVVVIDEHMARTAFAGRDPLGQHIRLEENRPLEVVGVVAHVNNYGLGEPEAAEDQFYLSWRQISPAWYVPTNSGFDITVRAKPGVEPTSLASAVAGAVESLDPEQPVHTVQTMQKLVDDSVSGRRFAMLLFGAFAAIALTLALTGLYSVMSYIVAQRTHEMGVRMALGAQPRQVQTMVVTQGLRLVGLGLGCGIVASLALGSFMSSILYGVRATDPLTFVSVSFVLAATAFFASWLPARRASRVDPIVALRSE